MDRYFFEIDDGAEHPDIDGTELPSLQAARLEAARRIARWLEADPARFWSGDEWHMVVKDARRLILFSLCIVGNDAASIRCESPGAR